MATVPETVGGGAKGSGVLATQRLVEAVAVEQPPRPGLLGVKLLAHRAGRW